MDIRAVGRIAAGLVLAALALGAGQAMAGTVTVDANAVIYAAGTQSAVASGTGGSVPTAIVPLTAGASDVTFSNVTGSYSCAYADGCITINYGTGTNYNDPDGSGAAVGSSHETGAGSISGITAPNAGYLVGVFLAAGGPSGPAPSALNFVSSGTSFTSLSPLIDQVFFIGDGLTGDNSGTQQTFYVPAGATELVLGISDACAYNGGPGCYGDNLGSYSVTYDVAGGVPEPASLSLLGIGVLALGMRRRRKLG